jgi:hypothetical protein
VILRLLAVALLAFVVVACEVDEEAPTVDEPVDEEPADDPDEPDEPAAEGATVAGGSPGRGAVGGAGGRGGGVFF